jgi:hypothetical protein
VNRRESFVDAGETAYLSAELIGERTRFDFRLAFRRGVYKNRAEIG